MRRVLKAAVNALKWIDQASWGYRMYLQAGMQDPRATPMTLQSLQASAWVLWQGPELRWVFPQPLGCSRTGCQARIASEQGLTACCGEHAQARAPTQCLRTS